MPDAQVPEGAVIITATEMYREMQDIGRKVDHLTSVVDPALQQVRSDISDVRGEIVRIVAERKIETTALGVRVTNLEHWRWFVLGIAAPVAAGAGYLLTRLFG